jgi:hypothetical protein
LLARRQKYREKVEEISVVKLKMWQLFVNEAPSCNNTGDTNAHGGNDDTNNNENYSLKMIMVVLMEVLMVVLILRLIH